MGFLDRLAGRPAQPQEEDKPKEEQQRASTSSEVLHDIAPPAAGSVGGGFPSHPGRLYDPYEGISSAMGGRKHTFQLPEGPEFVFQEEAAARRRGWGENLQFYTGVGYLGGALIASLHAWPHARSHGVHATTLLCSLWEAESP